MTFTITRHHLIATTCIVIALAIGIAIGYIVFASGNNKPIVIQRHIHSVTPLTPKPTPTPEPLPECMVAAGGGSWHWHGEEFNMNQYEYGWWHHHDTIDCR